MHMVKTGSKAWKRKTCANTHRIRVVDLFLKLRLQPLPELLFEATYHSTVVVVTYMDQLGHVLSLHDDFVAVVFVFACVKALF